MTDAERKRREDDEAIAVSDAYIDETVAWPVVCAGQPSPPEQEMSDEESEAHIKAAEVEERRASG